MNNIYLALGSNLGNLVENIEKAYLLIEEKIGKIAVKSSYFYSEPYGFVSENNFINTVICLESNLSPFELLAQLEGIEKQMGRENKSENKNHFDRIMDIDILYYKDLIVAFENLKIPHNERFNRKFVTQPLLEIAPDFIDPEHKIEIKSIVKCE